MAGKVLFHIDLNSFFASAEILKNEALRGKPVVVAGLHRRSVVCTASYEARCYGVHSAMPLHMALDKCPDMIVVQGDYNWYTKVSNQFFTYLHRFSPFLEPASIDECYLDVTEVIKKYKRPLDLAWQIQKSVADDLGLPCSIGVAPNKFLAKMASDMQKPMGITILRKQELPRKLWPLPIKNMWGIGRKTVPILEQHGIATIGDLAHVANERKVMHLLGKHAYTFIQNARGNGNNKLSYNNTVQSISQSTTLDCDIREYDEVRNVFQQLSKALSRRAKKDSLKGSLISISIRYYDFTNVVRSTTLQEFTDDDGVLLNHALLLFDTHDNGMGIRHLGIGLGSLFSSQTSIDQMNLFDQQVKDTNSIRNVLHELNKQIPKAHLITLADMQK